MRFFAIDTSADETSAAITDKRKVIASFISSQISSHAKWGGIVPSIAKLAHAERIDKVCEEVLKKAKLKKYNQNGVDAVAVTVGPGLSVALEVGIKKAKQIATEYNLPLYAINHMEGHLYSPFVQNSKGNPDIEIAFPFLSLLVSGGHTQIVNVVANGNYEIVGETQDDAAGEALDKAAKMLGLGYPGGEVIEKLAKEVDNLDKYKFPRPMINDPTLNMSFSGLKTHFYYLLKGEKGLDINLDKDIKYLASSFQEAVFDVLLRKLKSAINIKKPKHVCVGGGVSANKYLRKKIRLMCKDVGIKAYFPSYKYLCGDNAAMIGVAAYMMSERKAKPADLENMDRLPRHSLCSAKSNDQ